MIHSSAGTAVLAYLSIELDGDAVAAERVLAELEIDQLVHVAATAQRLADVALGLSRPSEHDFIPPAAVAAAQREHQRAVPEAYDRPGPGFVVPDPPRPTTYTTGGWVPRRSVHPMVDFPDDADSIFNEGDDDGRHR